MNGKTSKFSSGNIRKSTKIYNESARQKAEKVHIKPQSETIAKEDSTKPQNTTGKKEEDYKNDTAKKNQSLYSHEKSPFEILNTK